MPLKISNSSFSVVEIMGRIEKTLQAKGIAVFARISHSDAAKKVGLVMPDEELIIFGNPAVGTALMIEDPAVGIELPLKILAWREGQITRVAYKDPMRLLDKYGIKENAAVITSFGEFLNKLVQSVIQ